MTRAELVEKMARAMCKTHGTGQCAALCLSHSSIFTTGGQCPEAPRIYDTTAALAAIEAAGCVVMPREALEKALEALLKSEPILYGRYDGRGYWDRHQEAEQAVRSALGQTP
jgi:hypothetical protein